MRHLWIFIKCVKIKYTEFNYKDCHYSYYLKEFRMITSRENSVKREVRQATTIYLSKTRM